LQYECGVDGVPHCSMLSADVYVPVINAINFFAHIAVTAFLVHVTDIFYCTNERAVVSQHCVTSVQSRNGSCGADSKY
jgi:hypothetical protein